MAAVDKAHVVVDVEEGEVGRRSAATGRRSYPESGSEGSEDEEKRCFSESSSEIVERESSATESSVEVDLEEVKMHVAKVERDCRICHLSLDATNHESGIPIELGCSCKADLAAAHKHCAEAWFKIKGNKCCDSNQSIEQVDVRAFYHTVGMAFHANNYALTNKSFIELPGGMLNDRTCEICGSTARNVSGLSEADLAEQWHDEAALAAAGAPVQTPESRNFWHGHRFLNFLLACMVFAFVISWLFHFNVPS